ncbi:unnamed protein product [Closterium sp. Naga37s-1]|nr:unnamed protein product [Closterium sp. Naga37s-1]
MLQRSIQELRDLQPTLLDAATYAEEAYLVTDQKDIELHNVRDYAVSMLVSVVDRIGAAADRFTDAVSLQAKEMAAADVRVASAAERVRACWEYSGRNALNRQQQPHLPFHVPDSMPILCCTLLSLLQRVRACWEYSGRNALNRQQQPRATSHMPKSYLLPAEAAAEASALAAARAPSAAPASAAAAAACMERECFQYGSGYSASPTRDPRGSSHTALSSSSLLSSMPLAPPSESLLDSLASSSLVPRSATAGMPSVRASLDCLAGLPPSSSSTSSSSSFPSFSSSFPSSSTVPHSSSTLSNPSAATPHSADKILSRKQSHSHNLSHSPNLSHSHNLPHFSNLSRSHNLSQSHGLMHSLSHSLSQHMGHRGSHARQSKEPTTPKGHFPLVASSLHAGGASGVDDVEGSDRRSTTPHRRGRQLLKNIFSRGADGGAAGAAGGAGGAGAGAAGASGALGDGSNGYTSTQRAHDRGYSGHL